MIKQITVFIENKPGRLMEVTGALAKENINIHALSIADTADFGIVRIIASDADKAKKTLRDKGFMVKTADVIALAMGQRPGSLHEILSQIAALDISVEYIYAFTSRHSYYDAIVILRLNNPEMALEKLKDSSIPVLGQELVDSLNEA